MYDFHIICNSLLILLIQSAAILYHPVRPHSSQQAIVQLKVPVAKHPYMKYGKVNTIDLSQNTST